MALLSRTGRCASGSGARGGVETAVAAAQEASRSRIDTPAGTDGRGPGRPCGWAWDVDDMDAS
ncbi:hypothetical protein [Streptomyces sp. NPDC020571]|uniref:hypothetical protein n=1 Tax=Streptomyces sp. NPDC020571 TaxID=3365079 RepID=UPI00378A8813